MNKATGKLNSYQKKLYGVKKWPELYMALAVKGNANEIISALCEEDNEFADWWIEASTNFWNAVFSTPWLEETMHDTAEKEFRLEEFNLRKKIYNQGFATVEDCMELYGASREEIERAVQENPHLFRGRVLSGMVQ